MKGKGERSRKTVRTPIHILQVNNYQDNKATKLQLVNGKHFMMAEDINKRKRKTRVKRAV